MKRAAVLLLLVSVLIAFIVNCVNAQRVNNRPIIGIVTEPVDGIWTPKPGRTEYIAASYVKWVESSGARVVPVRWSTPTSQLGTLLKCLNGLVFPGGGVDLDRTHPYYKTLEYIFSWVLKENDAGNYFPLWGTCLGFEEISILASGGANILSPVDAENYTIPLNFTSALSSSRIFKNSPSGVLNTLSTQPVTMNNHVWGVYPSTYDNNQQLRDFFTVISTNVDRKGRTFLSTIEGKKYPVYGTQWHPEKISFEWWASEVINHSHDSIVANRQTSDFLRSEASKSPNSFSSQTEERSKLIYNWAPVYTFEEVHDFEQCYFF